MRTSVLAVSAAIAVVCLGCRPQPTASAPRSGMSLSQTVPAEPGAEAPRGAPAAGTAEADRLYQEGLDYYLKGRPGNPDSNSNLQQASKRFRAALLIYERAARDHPADRRLQGRIQDCNSKIYACAKMQTL